MTMITHIPHVLTDSTDPMSLLIIITRFSAILTGMITSLIPRG